MSTKNNLPLFDDLEIKNYQDYKKNRNKCFNLISDIMDMMLKETSEKNPTFLLDDYDKMIDIKRLKYE